MADGTIVQLVRAYDWANKKPGFTLRIWDSARTTQFMPCGFVNPRLEGEKMFYEYNPKKSFSELFSAWVDTLPGINL